MKVTFITVKSIFCLYSQLFCNDRNLIGIYLGNAIEQTSVQVIIANNKGHNNNNKNTQKYFLMLINRPHTMFQIAHLIFDCGYGEDDAAFRHFNYVSFSFLNKKKKFFSTPAWKFYLTMNKGKNRSVSKLFLVSMITVSVTLIESGQNES